MDVTHPMDVQNEGNVLLLPQRPVQGDLHRLLGEALDALAEEMHLHLVVEDWGGRNTGPINTFTHFSYHYLKGRRGNPLRKQSVCPQICAKSGFKPPKIYKILTQTKEQQLNIMLTLSHVQQSCITSASERQLKYLQPPGHVTFGNTSELREQQQLLLLASLGALVFLRPTFVGHRLAGLEVHLGPAGRADLVDVVA